MNVWGALKKCHMGQQSFACDNTVKLKLCTCYWRYSKRTCEIQWSVIQFLTLENVLGSEIPTRMSKVYAVWNVITKSTVNWFAYSTLVWRWKHDHGFPYYQFYINYALSHLWWFSNYIFSRIFRLNFWFFFFVSLHV